MILGQLLKDVGLRKMRLPHAVKFDQQDVVQEVLELLHEHVLRLKLFLLLGKVRHTVWKNIK